MAVAGGDGGPASDRVAADGARHTPGPGPRRRCRSGRLAVGDAERLGERGEPERTAREEEARAHGDAGEEGRARRRAVGDAGTGAHGRGPGRERWRRVRVGAGLGSGSGTAAGSGAGVAAGGPEAQVLALVNEERAAAGCAPVTENARLTRAADDYSDVMAESGVMSHTGPDGSTMTTRVEAAGYAWSTLGENIARGQADAAAVMESWMNSPGHRANILNCSFKELGVGVHFGDGGPWWTQNFGAPR